jgi:hypothetical protein
MANALNQPNRRSDGKSEKTNQWRFGYSQSYQYTHRLDGPKCPWQLHWWVPLERYRFTIWDDDSFEYVAEWVYVSALAAEAEAIQVAKELSEDDDTWHGGWISVEDWRGHEIAKVPIGIGRRRSRSRNPFG